MATRSRPWTHRQEVIGLNPRPLYKHYHIFRVVSSASSPVVEMNNMELCVCLRHVDLKDSMMVIQAKVSDNIPVADS